MILTNSYVFGLLTNFYDLFLFYSTLTENGEEAEWKGQES